MKTVELPNRGTEVGGVAQTTKFTIAANGKIIRNVISSIYSAKEKTVVRELMANALDAHAAAGKEDCPIEVYIPAPLDSTFVVRDFGVGMDHDFVMTHYSALGFSTKETTNSQTGMFGVGSKSPLAICDTFTVRCFDKPGWNGDQPYVVRDVDLNVTGRIRLYTVAITDDDVPQISHTFDVVPKESDRVEEGGVEIKVPISSSSRSKIIEGIYSQHFCWFDRPVKFFGAVQEVEQGTYRQIFKIADSLYIGLAKPSSSTLSYSSTKVFVRQGAAVYPVDFSSGTLYYKLSPTATRMTRTLASGARRLMLDLPIGTVDVTMAREGIQYNEASINNLVAAYEAAAANYVEVLESQVGDARTIPAALDKLCEKYLPEGQEITLPVLKDMAALIPMISARVEKNHVAWEESRLGAMDGGIAENLADEQIFRGSNPTLRLLDFPEGKVIIHKWTIYGETSTYVSKQGPKDSVSVSYPYVAVVLPSHLEKWTERTVSFLKDKFSTAGFSNSTSEGVDVLIVRCAKRNIQGVKDALSRIAPYYACYTSEDFSEPEKLVKTPSTRTFSKTSVYKWSHSAGGFQTDKVEPDYKTPAYYFIRRGITDEVYGVHPENTHEGSRYLPSHISHTRVYDMIRNAREYGIAPSDVPIYRVTEKQAKLIADNAPEWEYFPYKLLDVLANDQSALTTALDYMGTKGYNRVNFHTGAGAFFQWLRYSSHLGADIVEGIRAFRTMMKADPLLETLTALRFCVENRNNGPLAGDNPLFAKLRRSVYYNFVEGDNSCAVSLALSDAEKVIEKRHDLFLYVLQRDRMILSPGAKAFMETAVPLARKEAVSTDMSVWAYAAPAVKKMNEALDKIVAECDIPPEPILETPEETEKEVKYA